ncbi:integrase arm-type DNA-binding domain-containing protein [Endozoicomonas sp. Mp262]|uniref:tyrosine-type recombinase/integrase n=1 Tax=Endozoicomonas sp. Mp262 TaxID=2919499 RepID=UPI0021DF9204
MGMTDAQARHAKPKEKEYKISDERGLFLLVKTSGSRLWRLKYRFHKKEKSLSLGTYPEVSLKMARQKRDDARLLLDEGKDPSLEKQIQKQLNVSQYENNFKTVGLEWYEIKLKGKSESHRSRSFRMLKKELFPYLGLRPVSDITTPELLTILRKIENRGVVDTAHRAKQTASQVFQYAIQTGKATHNPAANLAGALRPKNKKHYAAITTPRETGELMLAIDAFNGTAVVKYALKLSALTFLRPGEVRQLEWGFVNWKENRIDLPGRLMKIKTMPHIVPLADQTKKILKQIHCLTGEGKYIFPSQRKNGKPMSDNAVRTAIRIMGYDDQTMTAHGFRAMARTLLDEVLDYRVDWIEQQMAHGVKDPNGRAYNRTKHLSQRTAMMQRWADYLDELKWVAARGQLAAGDNVITARFRG